MDADFFKGNRARLLGRLEPGSLLVLAGFGSVQRDIDEPYAFQQEGNFWYLTGIAEPDWHLLIDVDSGKEWLFSPELNTYQTAFLGGLTPQRATEISGVAQVVPRKEGKQLLATLLTKKKKVYTLLPQSVRVYKFQANTAQRKLMRWLVGAVIHDVRLHIAKLRAIKQPAEIAALQQAVDITAHGIEAVLKEVRNNKFEYEIDARLYYEFRRRGALHAFDPIVASGAKTCILHSQQANDPLKDWLLLDVGARVNGYAADITRTVPLRPPTKREREVYTAVQRMHDYFEQLIKPGVKTEVLMREAYPYIGEEMVKLGLIKRPTLTRNGVFKYMPHGITHGIGVDVHDPLGRPAEFKENMALTNEVGIYIPEENIGIRIENDMLITQDGARNMAPKLLYGLDELMKMVY